MSKKSGVKAQRTVLVTMTKRGLIYNLVIDAERAFLSGVDAIKYAKQHAKAFVKHDKAEAKKVGLDTLFEKPLCIVAKGGAMLRSTDKQDYLKGVLLNDYNVITCTVTRLKPNKETLDLD